MGIHFCHIMLGIVGGIIFSLLFINFDDSWKKALSAIVTAVTTGGGVVAIYKAFGTIPSNTIFVAIGLLILSFVITFITTMFIIAYIIKDKDDSDVIRIRDILLGQKKYIDNYYSRRQEEITNKIIPNLEQRERDIAEKEKEIESDKRYLMDEFRKLEELGSRKQKIVLPERKAVIVSREYLEALPSYIEDLANCINDMKVITNDWIANHETISLQDFKAYLLEISLYISKNLFKSNDVRIHFRYYDVRQDGYRMLIAIKGENQLDKDMTFIPYSKASMIKRSYECRRALIKSMNPKYDFRGNNFALWEDYMTFTFYNLKKQEKACLSFGISVKNAARFKKTFVFLNHASFEDYLQENLERINDKYNIANVLYDDEEVDVNG